MWMQFVSVNMLFYLFLSHRKLLPPLSRISIHLTYLLHPHPLHHLHQPLQLLHHLRARYHPNHQQQGNLVNVEYVHIVYHLEDLLA